MALDSDAVLDAVLNVLKNNTATIATSLTSHESVRKVDVGDLSSAPIPNTEYPALLVNLTRETEEFAQSGQRKNKHTLEFSIWPLIYTVEGGRTAALKDARKMVQNTKTVLKDNITLSGTAAYSLPEEVDYDLGQGGTFQAGARILLRTHHWST